MTIDANKPEIEQLRRFHLLDLMSARHLNYLREKALLLNYVAGDLLFSPPRSRSMGYYLIKGRVEISMGDISRVVEAESSASYCSLEEKLPENATAKILDDSTILQLSRVLVEQYFSWSTTGEYRVVDIDDIGKSVESQQNEWLKPFLNSSLTKNLSKKKVDELVLLAKDRRARKQEVLLHQGEAPSKFFILKSGGAKVLHVDGSEKALHSGDFFGDESIVPNAPSSIQVEMSSNGVVAEIEKSAFNAIVKSSLVVKVRPDQLSLMGDIGWRLLDVRFPSEYKLSHSSNSTNIPVSTLQNKMETFDPGLIYFLTVESGARGELACYILQKEGFRAYVLDVEASNIIATGEN